jgi:hypothetical protein
MPLAPTPSEPLWTRGGEGPGGLGALPLLPLAALFLATCAHPTPAPPSQTSSPLLKTPPPSFPSRPRSTIFANSSLEPTGFDNAGNQRDRTYSVVDAKEAVVGQPRSPPLDMPRGGPYVEGSVRTPDLEPALPLFGQPFKAFVKVRGRGRKAVGDWASFFPLYVCV